MRSCGAWHLTLYSIFRFRAWQPLPGDSPGSTSTQFLKRNTGSRPVVAERNVWDKNDIVRTNEENMKKLKILLSLSIMAVACGSTVQAGKTSGNPPPPPPPSGAFTFGYNVGTAANYHAYGFACQVGAVKPKPAGTVVLGNWWVWDLGPVTGAGTVNCPKPVVLKGQTSSVLGILFFANASDVGGQPFSNPVVDVQIFTPKWYNGYASIEVMPPPDNDSDDSGIQLYWGVPFNPFVWDLSAYVWNVEPAGW